MVSAESHDVIVVGGGPVGLLVANELALHGAAPLVLEQRSGVSEYPKAGTYHARAIATLARRGIVAVPRRTNDHRAVSSEPFQFAGFPWLTMRGRTIDGPVMLGIAQADLERAIAVHAEQSGARVLRDHTVIEVAQDDTGVHVVARDRRGRERHFRARYVVGADGGRSVVRTCGAFDVREYPPTMRAILGLATVEKPEQIPVGWSHTPRGWTLLNLNRYGESRVIVFEFDGPAEDRAAPVSPEEFCAAVDRVVGSHVELTDPHYLNRFSDFSRVAGAYRDRSLFLAGDAAHIHYPLGGQGLNTGIVDGVNLGWKLSAVISGAADESLLDTYGSERQPVGQWIIDNTRLQSKLMNPDVDNDPLRSVFAQMLCSPEAHDWLADRINGTALRHETGSGDARLDGVFLPDHELTLAGGQHSSVSELLRAGQFLVLARSAVPGSLAATDSLPFTAVVSVDEGLPADYPEVIVVRPDGYVAWAGESTDTAAMVSALATYFGLRCPQPVSEMVQ
ncbi:FAD-dependent monooxygenase [Gordonia sp. CPCC 206044]|uniref:FAD-dependent monooxygenase n=1 Tax=Gordonia sp. CPCC 206044 TaxID=3140793 RepID=UPI003AF3F703